MSYTTRYANGYVDIFSTTIGYADRINYLRYIYADMFTALVRVHQKEWPI